MSELPHVEPVCTKDATPSIDLVIEARPRDLGGFSVRRVLPSVQRRQVGPFVFVDQMGPADFAPGSGIDVRPHPHIALATITYLFDGEIMHRDSVGSVQVIRAGDVNWMVAGSGIAHSERTPEAFRQSGGRLYGVQTWVALPRADEETAPRFEHHPERTIPVVRRPGVTLHVIAGTAYGERAPTGVFSPTLYVHARMDDGATLEVDDTHEERAVYVVDGAIDCDGRTFAPGTMFVLHPASAVRLEARGATNVMLLGGAPLDGPRHIVWNFVSSSSDRIEQAKRDWREGRFAKVIGDETEHIPLPEGM